MFTTKLYRTLATACVAAALFTAAGCSDMKSQSAMRVQQYDRWNVTRVSVMYQLAEQQYAVGDYDKCRKTIEEALALKAPFPKLYTLAGKLELEKGSLEVAADRLKESIRIDSTDSEPFYLLGVVYQRWQNADTAADYYQQAWDRKSTDALYLLAVVEMKISAGKLDEAQKILEDKLVYFEQSAAVRIALARISGLKGDHAAACRYYSDAVILTPDDASLRRSYAEELFFSKKYADAAAIFEDMCKNENLKDRENILLMLGESYMNLNRPFDARNSYQEITRNNPNNLQAYVALAKACVETHDLGIALAATQKVLRNEPNNSQALVLQAVVQQREKHWSDADDTLHRAAKVDPKDTMILCMLGIGAQQMGKQDDAITYYEQAVAINPNDAWAIELRDKAKPAASVVPANLQSSAEPVATSTVATSDKSSTEAENIAASTPTLDVKSP